LKLRDPQLDSDGVLKAPAIASPQEQPVRLVTKCRRLH
jgi:hypothetical protein